jgi:magnesium-transporting ATPase (P-type)
MNFLLAPIALLLGPMNVGLMRTLAPSPGPNDRSVLRFATLITLIMIFGGFYFLIAGTPGDVAMSGKGFEITTRTAGIAVLIVGLLFYFAICWRLTRR